MPRLLLLAASEKVLIERGSGVASMINVLERVAFAMTDEHKSEENILVAMPWAILTIWRREPTDEATEYEQHIRIVAPSGDVKLQGTMPFSIPLDKPGHRQTMRLKHFPASEQGDYLILAAVREKGATNWDWRGEYPIAVAHDLKPGSDETVVAVEAG